MTDEEKERWLLKMLNGETDGFEMTYIKIAGENWKYINNQDEQNVNEDLHEKLLYL